MGGFKRFVNHYPSLSEEIPKNLYGVVKNLSVVDSHSIQVCLSNDGVPFDSVDMNKIGIDLENVEAVLQSEERLFLPTKAEKYFSDRLFNIVEFDTEITESGARALTEGADLVVDCTYNSIFEQPSSLIHEATLMLKVKRIKPLPFGALTLIDGPFWSLYPTELESEFSLSHVAFGPLVQKTSAAELTQAISGISENLILERSRKIFDSVIDFWPSFPDYFSDSEAYFVQRKVKRVDASDSRHTSIRLIEPQIVEVTSGKIDAAFGVSDWISNYLDGIA